MANYFKCIIRNMLCKKCEPEQKTASKLVDAEQRESLACVKKIKSAIIHQRWLSCLGAAKLWLLRKLIRRRFFCPAPFFKIITDKVYVSAYHSNPLFMKNSKMMMNNIFSKSCGNYNHRLKNHDHRLENRNHRLALRSYRLDIRGHRLNNHNHKLDNRHHRLDNRDHRLDNRDHRLKNSAHRLKN